VDDIEVHYAALGASDESIAERPKVRIGQKLRFYVRYGNS
jgi:hypothetical protein